MSPSPLLVTGAAGFIGHAVAHRLLDRGEQVIGVDNLNDYYDPRLKAARVANLDARPGFTLVRADVADAPAMQAVVRGHRIARIVHLAAQAGVRYSLDHPFAYEHSNVAGHLAILEAARQSDQCEHLVYASSSSVYGDRPIGAQGFREDEPCIDPVSLYAATKRSCELMSNTYGHLFRLPQTGLRFFTVYGPWGRPDMAYFGFTRKILAGEPIQVFGDGHMARDFTYIDDVVDGVIGALDRPAAPGENRILNLGNSRPAALEDMIDYLEQALGVKALKIMRPMQPGDVTSTYADVTRLAELTGYSPKVMLREGLQRFAGWYRDFYPA